MQLAEGRFVVQDGYESGPTLLVWNSRFKYDKFIARRLKTLSWVSNHMTSKYFNGSPMDWPRLKKPKFDDYDVGRYVLKNYPKNVLKHDRYNVELKEPFFVLVDFSKLKGRNGKLVFVRGG